MTLGRRLFNTLIVLLAIAAVAIDAFFVWWWVQNKDNYSQYTAFAKSIQVQREEIQQGSSQIQVDELPTLEINYYSNEDGLDGYTLAEICVNHYTDVDTQQLYKSGIQYYGPLDIFNKDHMIEQLVEFFEAYDIDFAALGTGKDFNLGNADVQGALDNMSDDMLRSIATYDALNVADIVGEFKRKDFKEDPILYSKDPDVDNFITKGYFSAYDGTSNSGTTAMWDTTSDTMRPSTRYIIPIGDNYFAVTCDRNTFKVSKGWLADWAYPNFYGTYYTTWGYMLGDIMSAVRSNSIGTGETLRSTDTRSI